MLWLSQRAIAEDADGKGGERDRHHDRDRGLAVRGARRGDGLPGRGGDQDEPEPPAHVVRAAGGVRAVGGLHQVDAVGDPEGDDAGEQQRERAVEAPAAQGHDRDDHRHHHQVEERVGEVRRDRQRTALGGVRDGLEDDRRAEGADGERGAQAIHPDGLRGAADALASDQHEAREPQRAEQQVADVGGGGDGNDLGVPQDLRVVDLARGPRADAQRDQRPAPGLLAGADRAGDAQHRRGDERHEVNLLGEEAVDAQMRRRDDMDLVRGDPRDDQRVQRAHDSLAGAGGQRHRTGIGRFGPGL